MNNISVWITEYLPGALAALAILAVGWLVALFLAAIVRGAVRCTKIGVTMPAG